MNPYLETVRGDRPKSDYVRDMFGSFSDRYNLFNRAVTLGLDRHWRKLLVRRFVKPGQQVLDLATGTGTLAWEIVRAQKGRGRVVGVDFCQPMIQVAARDRARRDPSGASQFLLADAQTLPFGDGMFDLATMGYALRNVSDIPRTLSEIHRVLRPQGCAVFLEISKPSRPWMRTLHFNYLRWAVPAIGFVLTGLRDPWYYLRDSVIHFIEPRDMLAHLTQAGFVSPSYHPLIGGAIGIYAANK